MENTLPRPLFTIFCGVQLSQSPALTQVKLALTQVRGRISEVAPFARCGRAASGRDSLGAIDHEGAHMDPRLNAIYIYSRIDAMGRGWQGLASSDDGPSYDERSIRRSDRRARGAARRARGGH